MGKKRKGKGKNTIIVLTTECFQLQQILTL